MKDNHLLNQNREIAVIAIEDIPNIDLYVDQVTTFMDTYLNAYKRYDDDKTLTKTMINNYAKARLFPAPAKKKYTKNHIMLLIIIFHLKTILSINDISKLLSSVITSIETDPKSHDLEVIYTEFTKMQQAQKEDTAYEIKAFDKSETMFNILTVLELVLKSNSAKREAENIIDIKL